MMMIDLPFLCIIIQGLMMQDALVFSHKNKIKCTDFLNDNQFILAGERDLSIFDIGEVKITHSCGYGNEDIMPIALWVISSDKNVVLQGKMGWNYVFVLKEGVIKYLTKYRTHVHGFCKMLCHTGNRMIGVSQEEKAIVIFNMVSGELLCKAVLQQQKLCDSITCLQIGLSEGQEEGNIMVYLAQEGSHIHHFDVPIKLEDNLVEELDSLKIPNNQEVSIINSMEIMNGNLYCLLRKHPFLHILSMKPKLVLLSSIDFQFQAPRHLTSHSSKNHFYLTDGNKIIKFSQHNHKISTLAQLHQSKSLECISFDRDYQAMCGCSEEKQFFYLDLHN